MSKHDNAINVYQDGSPLQFKNILFPERVFDRIELGAQLGIGFTCGVSLVAVVGLAASRLIGWVF